MRGARSARMKTGHTGRDAGLTGSQPLLCWPWLWDLVSTILLAAAHRSLLQLQSSDEAPRTWGERFRCNTAATFWSVFLHFRVLVASSKNRLTLAESRRTNIHPVEEQEKIGTVCFKAVDGGVLNALKDCRRSEVKANDLISDGHSVRVFLVEA